METGNYFLIAFLFLLNPCEFKSKFPKREELEMNENKTIISGTFWTGLGKYSEILIVLITTAILARILNPSDFGIIGMVYIYNRFLTVIGNAGISSAVIQKRNLNSLDLSSVFWFSLTIGFATVTFTFFVSPLIGSFFNFPELEQVLKTMSINFIFLGLSNVPLGIMRKAFRFHDIAVIDIVSNIFSGIIAVTSAFGGFGYWALVFQSISLLMFKTIGYLTFCRWKPHLVFSFKVVGQIWTYSGYILGFSIINYWARNADNILIGKFMGPDQLGFYSQAYRLMTLPIVVITGIITPTLHPIFSKYQDSTETMKQSYFKVLEVVGLLSFPMGIFFLLFSKSIIVFIWGEKFLSSVPVFRILAPLTMLQPIIAPSGTVLMALNKTKLLFFLGSFNALIMIGGITLGLPFGITGVALGYSVSYITIVFPLTLFFLSKSLGSRLYVFLKALLKPILISLILFSFMVLFKNLTVFESNFHIIITAFTLSMIIFTISVTALYYSRIMKLFHTVRRDLK